MKVLRWVLRMLIGAKERLWDFFDAFNEDKLYVPETSDVIRKYLEFKVDDIEEFSAIYTYDFHDKKRILDNKKSKLQMYNQVYKMMKALKENGSLDN